MTRAPHQSDDYIEAHYVPEPPTPGIDHDETNPWHRMIRRNGRLIEAARDETHPRHREALAELRRTA